MPIFPVPSGQFAGMVQADLLALRSQAQAALFAFMMGGKPQSLSYTQADGSKSVSYAATSRADLQQFIRQINGALGQSGRAALTPIFR